MISYLKSNRLWRMVMAIILPFHNPSASTPVRLRLPVPDVSTKALKSSLSLHVKVLFTSETNELSKYCKGYHYEVNRSVLHIKGALDNFSLISLIPKF